jgi:hypothetical protein
LLALLPLTVKIWETTWRTYVGSSWTTRLDAKGFEKTQLWTFNGLNAARHLYESNGFKLAEENLGNQWGTEIMEQRFCRAPQRP